MPRYLGTTPLTHLSKMKNGPHPGAMRHLAKALQSV
jgi:hypothetical protein